MKNRLFLGDSITDADHLFDPENLGYGYVRMLSEHPSLQDSICWNRGHDGFTTEQVLHMLRRDGLGTGWDSITLLVGVNDIPVELYTNRPRIPDEFAVYYEEILKLLAGSSAASLILLEPFIFDTPAEYSRWHDYVQQESRMIRQLAEAYGAKFVPVDARLRQEAQKRGASLITKDGIHLTDAGNRLLADYWLEACF